jgi:hypothetical protein
MFIAPVEKLIEENTGDDISIVSPSCMVPVV